MPLPFVATGLFTFLGGLLARFFSDSLVKWLAFKGLAIALVTITLPIVLKNVITWLFEVLHSVAGSALSGNSMSSVMLEFSGFAGYLASHLLLPDCLAVILTAVSIRLILNFIPLVG